MPEGQVRTALMLKGLIFVQASGIAEDILCRIEMYRGGACPMPRTPYAGQLIIFQDIKRGPRGLFARDWHFADEDKNFHAEVQAPLCNGNGYKKGKRGRKIRR